MLAIATIPYHSDGIMFRPNRAVGISEKAGQSLEKLASALSLSRVVGGLAVANHIEKTPDYQSWKLAFTFGALAATDFIDGKLARYGRKLQGKNESVRRPFNAYVDQLSDKVMIDAILVAVAKREGQNGHYAYSQAMSGAALVDMGRNVLVTRDRVNADRQNIDSRAQKGGKLKALEQDLVVGAALSPLSKNRVGRFIIGVAAAHSEFEAVKSGIDLHASFEVSRSQLATQEVPETTVEQPQPSSDQWLHAGAEYLASHLAESPHLLN